MAEKQDAGAGARELEWRLRRLRAAQADGSWRGPKFRRICERIDMDQDEVEELFADLGGAVTTVARAAVERGEADPEGGRARLTGLVTPPIESWATGRSLRVPDPVSGIAGVSRASRDAYVVATIEATVSFALDAVACAHRDICHGTAIPGAHCVAHAELALSIALRQAHRDHLRRLGAGAEVPR